jgi:hypothetical protein
MADDVYANGMEIACKAGDGKVIAAFPDVCLSPPPPPAGPVPIPYPITSMDSDTDSGSKTVSIGGQEVMLKDQSYYKQCTGDEAATKSQGMGVMTGCITGKVYFAMWSSDVKFEGENVDRHLDITNGNGQSNTNQISWPRTSKMKVGGEKCDQVLDDEGIFVHKYKDRDKYCKTSQQSDHIVQNACFQNTRGGDAIDTAPGYTMEDAPCVCLNDATNPRTQHGKKTAAQNAWAQKQRDKGTNPTLGEVEQANMDAMDEAKPEMSDEARECLKKVVEDHFENQLKMKKTDQVRTPKTGDFEEEIPKPSPRKK